MSRSDNRAALLEEVARFQAEVRRLALAVVQEIVREERERRLTKAPRRRGRGGSSARAAAPAARSRKQRAPAAAAAESKERAPAPADEAQPPGTPGGSGGAAAAAAAGAPANGRKGRVTWTRESIIAELASWMASGTAIEAAFVARHGPPGLVAATRRLFGRFEAGLNVAALHVSKLYPDGPPERLPG
jgi:hypothetical protein